ncbi:MAG: precorrin-2 C(20)-methyltransferase [Oscillatoriales cyanobacterium RM2_1_1]|nr:precorrin-2 C(20)-methyltransferase [Oscillatoriales cyanobacterium RM2_1_1]
MSSPQTRGLLYGISVGPGDPELITVKGLNILRNSPVVAFPAGTAGKPGIAQGIIRSWLQANQLQLPLEFPYVQDEVILQTAWDRAAAQVWPYLAQGMNVAFACEGDVSFYSTFTYLAQTLRKLHPEARVQAIPGVCSPLAAVASLGLPLTVRDQRLAILPGFYGLEALEGTLDQANVVVLMKVKSVYSQVWALLQRRGLLDSAYVVEWATLPHQVIYAGLGDRPQLDLSYFSLLVIFAT